MLKVGTPVGLVVVVEGVELLAVRGLKGSSLNGVKKAWEKSVLEVCSQVRKMSEKLP